MTRTTTHAELSQADSDGDGQLSTAVPLSEAELASVAQLAVVRRPVHWLLVARLVAEVRAHRRDDHAMASRRR